jgi:hypothetical protein
LLEVEPFCVGPDHFALPGVELDAISHTNKAIASALRKAKGGYRFRQER